MSERGALRPFNHLSREVRISIHKRAGAELLGTFWLVFGGCGPHSPGGYSLLAGLASELVMTFMFLMPILGATDKKAPQGLAPIAGAVAAGFVYNLFGEKKRKKQPAART